MEKLLVFLPLYLSSFNRDHIELGNKVSTLLAATKGEVKSTESDPNGSEGTNGRIVYQDDDRIYKLTNENAKCR